MKIAPISNYKLIGSGNTNPVRQQSNVSFARGIYLKGKVSDVNSNIFPEELYVNLDKVYESFKNQKPYQRWEYFRHYLAKLFTKRCNYLGLNDNSKFGALDFNKDKVAISVLDHRRQASPRTTDFDWTKEYKELEELFDGSEYSLGAAKNMNVLKKELPEVLKKQGWLKQE